MDVRQGYTRKRRGTAGEGIVELNGGALLVPSYTDVGVTYKTHPDSGYCSCKRFEFTGLCIKHVVLAEAVQEARGLRFGSGIAEENVVELCRRIFAPLDNKEHPIDSYTLFLEAMGSRYATDLMVREAMRRHGRILAINESRRAA